MALPALAAATVGTTSSMNIWRIAMAHVERRERRGKNGQVLRSYRVRWRGPDGKERNKSFKRKVDADRFAATVSADLVRGQYVDPDAGKILFETYARKWLAAQTFDEGTHVAVELRFRLHAFPVLGNRNLNDIQPSTIQGWLRTLTDLAPSYRQIIFAECVDGLHSCGRRLLDRRQPVSSTLRSPSEARAPQGRALDPGSGARRP